MLAELSIRDVLLIERLELDFHPGLNVLTGETGAGKSILLDCLGFVLGWRGRADIVRKGADQGEVSAAFTLPAEHPAWAVLDEAGLPHEDLQLLLRRSNSADGRKQGYVNDRRVSGDILRALSATLVELHGQHDDRGLLDSRAHRGLLDVFGQLEPKVARVTRDWQALSAARKARSEAEEALAAAARDTEYLRHSVAELDDLAPEPGEDAKLDTERRRMQMADKIREDIVTAAGVMGPDGAEGRLAEAIRWLEVVAERAEGELEAPIGALGRALNDLGEAQGAVETYLRDLDFDTHALERTEERLFAIRALARKHNVQPDDLAAMAEDLRQRLLTIDGGDAELERLAEAEAAALATFEVSAEALSVARRAAAARLDKAMSVELAPLKLDRAVFETQLAEGPPGAEGKDQVTFTVATNPGAPPGPLGKIASGGELSRFLLALKVCLTRHAQGLTMIFDEIDRGVGGATADAVGRRLVQVAEGAQVLVVTHAPQVAALGAHHLNVMKDVKADQTWTRVSVLDPRERVDEIARMLSGDVITDEARSAAQALLDGGG